MSKKITINLEEDENTELTGQLTGEEAQTLVKACFELVLGVLRKEEFEEGELEETEVNQTVKVPPREFTHLLQDNTLYDKVPGLCEDVDGDCEGTFKGFTCTRHKGHSGHHHAVMDKMCRGSWEEQKKGGKRMNPFKK